MKCEAFSTEAALAAALGRRVIDAIRHEPRLVLGLPTGRTPLALYSELIQLSTAEHVDWSKVRTFNLDEFVGLGRGDRGSYRTFMEERLFAHLNMRPENIEFLDGRAPDLDAECRRYEQAITTAGGIDLMILGFGVNGHIGFNEPAESLVSKTHRVRLDEPTRAANALWFDGDLERVPHEALTMGMGTILQSRAIVLIATGDAKSEAVTALLRGGVTTRFPASFLQLHPHVRVMLDDLLADQLP